MHRNISHKNIILIKQKNNGFLINLDFAIKLNNSSAFKAPNKTGTKIFITINIFKGEHYNPMHNLKFYSKFVFTEINFIEKKNNNKIRKLEQKIY